MPPTGYVSLTIPEIVVTSIEEWRAREKQSGNEAYASPAQVVIRLVINFLKQENMTNNRLLEIEENMIRASKQSKP